MSQMSCDLLFGHELVLVIQMLHFKGHVLFIKTICRKMYDTNMLRNRCQEVICHFLIRLTKDMCGIEVAPDVLKLSEIWRYLIRFLVATHVLLKRNR